MGKKAKKREKAKRMAAAAANSAKIATPTPCTALQAGDLAPRAGQGVFHPSPPQIASGAISGKAGDMPPALARILRPQSGHRWTMPSVQSMTPQYVETVLRGALTGDHVRQWEMFDLMLDTWPELAACQQELKEGVMARKLVHSPYAIEGEAPTESAMERMRVASAALRGMKPTPGADENDFDDTLSDILDGWFRGTVCMETDWHRIEAGTLGDVVAPRCTWWAHPQHFAWGADGALGLRTGDKVVPMPPHKFLVGFHKAKSGPAMGASLLRPLAWWWCASNFASDWLLNLAQLFGLPFRWANYDPNAPQGTVDAICSMLQNMGSAGWAAFPAGTTLELKHEGAGGNQSPQGDLLDRADRYARMLILGQTLSGSSDSSKGGGKAFGTVEEGVKEKRTDAAAKYAVKVINSQLLPSITELNFGDSRECPRVDLIDEEQAGSEEATRDETLSRMMPLPIPYLRAKYDVPEPAAGEEVTTAHAEAAKPQERQPVDNPLAAKLAALSRIEDDAIFAKQLHALAESL